MESYHVRICDKCGREHVRSRYPKSEVGCMCGGHEFHIVELAPIALTVSAGGTVTEVKTDA